MTAQRRRDGRGTGWWFRPTVGVKNVNRKNKKIRYELNKKVTSVE